MITKFKKSHKKIFKKNNSTIRNKVIKKTMKRRKKKNTNLKKTKKNQSGGALKAIIPEFSTITKLFGSTIPNAAIQTFSSGITGIDMLSRKFSSNTLSDLSRIPTIFNFIPTLINFLITQVISPTYHLTKNIVSLRLVGKLSSSQIATLGTGAGLLALAGLYMYGQMTDQQLLIDKKKKADIVSKKIDEFVRLEDLKMNVVRANYHDEELLSEFDKDPYYKYKQSLKNNIKNKINVIHNILIFIGNKKNIIENVERIKKIKELFIIIKNQPYLLEENTNLCFSKNLSGVNGIPLLFCIFNVTNDLRLLKLILNIYESSNLDISENDSIFDYLKTTKHNFSILDYLLSRKVKENNESLKKISWIISKLNYNGVSHQTVNLFFLYMRESYRLKIYEQKKKYPNSLPKLVTNDNHIIEEFDYFYKKFKTFRYTLVNSLQTLLVKYSHNNLFEYDNLFDSFLELLTIERNILPLDIQIIECLIIHNFEPKINSKNKDKFKNLKLLESQLMSQNQSIVIKKITPEVEFKKDDDFKYGQKGIRIDDEKISDFNSYKKITLNYQKTIGLHCSLTSNINYHYYKFKQNSQEKSVTPYILFPINKQEMEFEYMNTVNVNHSYSKSLVFKSDDRFLNKITTTDHEKTYLKYMSEKNITCTRIFGSLDAAVRDSHYHQVFFLNRPFKMKLVNNFIIYIKKTQKSYVKVSIDIKFKGRSEKTYHFWVLRNDIDFKYKDFINEEITSEQTNRQHLQITKERFIVRDKDNIGSWGENILLTGGWITNLIGKTPSFILRKQQTKSQSQINREKQDIGTVNILSYKDINVVLARNSSQLSNKNNQHNVIVLIFNNYSIWTRSIFIKEVERFITDGIITREYYNQIIEFKSSLFINKSTNYVYLENGNIVLLKTQPNDYSSFIEIIKVFLNSKSKKNLIIPYLLGTSINVLTILTQVVKKSIDQFYEENYHSIADNLFKSIIMVSTQLDYGKKLDNISDKLISDETREITPYTSLFVENKHNLVNQNTGISMINNFYNIYELIVPAIKQQFPDLDIHYSQYEHVLSIKNNTTKNIKFGANNFLFSFASKYTKIKPDETLKFSVGENYFQGEAVSNPKYIAISSTTIN